MPLYFVIRVVSSMAQKEIQGDSLMDTEGC